MCVPTSRSPKRGTVRLSVSELQLKTLVGMLAFDISSDEQSALPLAFHRTFEQDVLNVVDELRNLRDRALDQARLVVRRHDHRHSLALEHGRLYSTREA